LNGVRGNLSLFLRFVCGAPGLPGHWWLLAWLFCL
jgi:hypothetical protein